MTTDAGKRLLAEMHLADVEGYWRPEDREMHIAAVENEARAAERARLRERLKGLQHLICACRKPNCPRLAAVLAILEEKA